MHPHQDDTDLEEQPAPELVAFADAMRSVLRTRHDSTAGGPDALELWTVADGYVWRWSTPAGRWRVTAGAVPDPRPLLHGPGGIWWVDAPPGEHAAGLVLVMLRAAGAVPPAAPADPGRRYMPCCFAGIEEAQVQGRGVVCGGCGTPFVPPAAAQADPAPPREHQPPVSPVSGRAVVRSPAAAVACGQAFTPPPDADVIRPRRAVLYRPSDPVPVVPAGYVAVPAAANYPDDHGRWEITAPDGYRRIYDPARRCLIPHEVREGEHAGEMAVLLFEPGQLPGGIYPETVTYTPPAPMFEAPAGIPGPGSPSTWQATA